MDTWLDGVRNFKNYCAHNSMVVGLKSSIVLRHQKDAENLLPKNNDLYSRLYALKKLLSVEDAKSMKKDLVKLIKKSSVDILYLGLGASALCFVTWNFAVKELGAVKTSVYIYMVPVITVITSVLILHEKLILLAGIGTVLTLIGLFLSEYKPERNRTKNGFTK